MTFCTSCTLMQHFLSDVTTGIWRSGSYLNIPFWNYGDNRLSPRASWQWAMVPIAREILKVLYIYAAKWGACVLSSKDTGKLGPKSLWFLTLSHILGTRSSGTKIRSIQKSKLRGRRGLVKALAQRTIYFPDVRDSLLIWTIQSSQGFLNLETAFVTRTTVRMQRIQPPDLTFMSSSVRLNRIPQTVIVCPFSARHIRFNLVDGNPSG